MLICELKLQNPESYGPANVLAYPQEQIPCSNHSSGESLDIQNSAVLHDVSEDSAPRKFSWYIQVA
jgi:hypothetical protein